MLSRIDSYLQEDEILEVTLTPSLLDVRHMVWYVLALGLGGANLWLYLQPSGVLALIPVEIARNQLIYGFLIPLAILVFAEVKREIQRYHITDRRIIRELGLFNRSFVDIGYEKITDTKLRQPFYMQILDVGDILVNTAGKDEIAVVLKGIRKPKHYVGQIDSKTTQAHRPRAIEGGESVSSEELQAELNRIQRRREDLEQSYSRRAIDQAEYERRWYILEGEERVVYHLLDRIGEE